MAIMAEWTSGHSYTTRVENLRGTNSDSTSFAERKNQDYFLRATGDGQPVFDDNARDRLVGSGGRDWYFANYDNDDDGESDFIAGLKRNELVDDLDWFGE